MNEPVKVVTPLAKPASKSSNIKDLLSFANDEYVVSDIVFYPLFPRSN